jgi:hypothetical protein
MPDGSAGIHTVFASQDLPQDTLGAADQTATAIQNVLYGARAFSESLGHNLLAGGALGSARNHAILNFLFTTLSL